MEWTAGDDGTWSALGRWQWELSPYESKHDPKPDRWIMKGRHPKDHMWKWFGAYVSLAGAMDWAARNDKQASHEAPWRKDNEDDE